MGRVGRIVRPFVGIGVYANGAHSASMDREFAEQTEALAFRMCPTTRHYVLNNFRATVTTAAAWTEAGSASGIPWYVTPGFTRIGAGLLLASYTRTRVAVRLRTDDLLDAVASTTGNPSSVTQLAVPQRDRAFSSSDLFWCSPGMMTAEKLCHVDPTLPTSRRIAVHIDVMIPTLAHDVVVYVPQLNLMDMPTEEAGL